MIWTVAPSDRLTMCRSAYTCATSRYLCVERGMGVAKVMGQCWVILLQSPLYLSQVQIRIFVYILFSFFLKYMRL
jgi:hypothetical protein